MTFLTYLYIHRTAGENYVIAQTILILIFISDIEISQDYLPRIQCEDFEDGRDLTYYIRLAIVLMLNKDFCQNFN